MTGEGSLLKKLDDALNHLRMLEREKNEALARAAALEQEIKDLRGLISMAEVKAEEILKGMPGASVGAKPVDRVFAEPVAPVTPPADIKPPVPSAAFQELTDKGPLPSPADTRRRYTQVF